MSRILARLLLSTCQTDKCVCFPHHDSIFRQESTNVYLKTKEMCLSEVFHLLVTEQITELNSVAASVRQDLLLYILIIKQMESTFSKLNASRL